VAGWNDASAECARDQHFDIGQHIGGRQEMPVLVEARAVAETNEEDADLAGRVGLHRDRDRLVQ
jgi:hypothetical protein